MTPCLQMLHSRPTTVFKLLIPLPILHLLLPLPRPPPLAPGCPSMPHASSPPMTPLRLFNGMPVVFKPGALNCFTFFCRIPLTLSVSSNPILTHHSLFEFLDSLLCALILPTPGLAFPLVMQRTLVAASSFLSGRV